MARCLCDRHRVLCYKVPGKAVRGLWGTGELHLGRGGGPNLTAKVVEDMMKDYSIHHRISSVANPHANARAELGVNTVKRMLRDTGQSRGSRALLQLRNTPDRDTKLSPTKALYGR
jgi:hypothetical protein